MSQCIGICQMDEFGYCTGCGRSQAEIEGSAPAAPDPAPPGEHAHPQAPATPLFSAPAAAQALAPANPQSAGR